MRYFRVGDPMTFVATGTLYTQGSETRNMVLKRRNNMILRAPHLRVMGGCDFLQISRYSVAKISCGADIQISCYSVSTCREGRKICEKGLEL